MSTKKPPYNCQQYFNTNSCSNGEHCILQHISKESASSFTIISTQSEKGRTFAVLPVSDLRPPQPKPNLNNSKMPTITSNSKSSSTNKFKITSNNTTVKHKNVNTIPDAFPSLSKAQKKRYRRKGKAMMVDGNSDNLKDGMNEKNLCAKAKSDCKENCKSLHGDICDLCLRPVLHPLNLQFRREHSQQCVKQCEEEMKIKLATFHSMEKQCGICFESVMQKKGDCRFGILPDCNHCFCLVCIKIWRKSAGFGKAIRKSCPECRVVSHYVCPNAYWVENKEDKTEVIQNYKNTLARIDCKYFVKNQRCPFGNKCFYRHCDKDGTPVDLGLPRRNRVNLMRHRDLMMNALLDILNEDSDGSDDMQDIYSDFEFDHDSIYDDDDDDEDEDGFGFFC